MFGAVLRESLVDWVKWLLSKLFAVIRMLFDFLFGRRAAITVTRLRADYLTDPVGLEDARPTLSWVLESRRRNQVQRAYRIRAAALRQDLDDDPRWDSGKVISQASAGVPYAGELPGSRDRVWWQVRVWDGKDRPSAWSEPASFEMGLLDSGDWQADWITHPEWRDPELHPVELTLPATDARFVRLDVTKLGKPIQEGWPYPVSRLQLAEIEVRDSAVPTVNLARGAPVAALESFHVPGVWETRFVTDGVLNSEQPPMGYTSYERQDQVLDKPIWLRIDLGAVRHFDRIVLYPRTDVTTADGETAGFPIDFSINTANTASGPFTQQLDIVGHEPPPPYHRPPAALPVFAHHFSVSKPVKAARLYATGLGIHVTTLNGKPVTDAVLEPANTDYQERVEYGTYDVGHLLRNGTNAIAVQLGNGIYHVSPTPGRYQKFSRSLGMPKMRAQLEITYADGSREVAASNEKWRTTLGGTTVSSWYGGEDYDARRLPPDWNQPTADLSEWQEAIRSSPGEDVTLSSRSAPPIKIVDTLRAKEITEPASGVHVVDFGVNFAGWAQLKVSGEAGTTVTMRPSELLNEDGTVDQSTTGAPIYDRYTLAGNGIETWHPRFVYHGFRYLQLEGLSEAPTVDTVTGLVLRAANEPAGSFDCSTILLNQIHRIIDRAIQSNMYSVLTDCPHREKLGWLEEIHLVFDSIARNYDVAAYYRTLARDMAEAQLPDGLVPDIAPEYAVFSGGFRDDPNWGGAIVLTPLRAYRTYGDAQALATYYPNMVRYLEYLGRKARGNLLDYGLGDWIAFDRTTPLGVTATFAYHQLANGMAEIARVLGKTADVKRWKALAADIAAAFNAKYLDTTRHTYGSGSQACDALALDMGVVPAEHKQAVTDHLIDSIEAKGYHLTVGEIALPSVFRVLSEGGRDDLVYRIATQTGNPSYGYQVVHGATSLTENWDGPTSGNSQNHFMLGVIDEWFTTGLAGIKAAPGAIGYDKLLIKPAVVDDLTHAKGTYRTPYGTVVSNWRRQGRRFRLDIQIPVNTTATVHVPGSAKAGRGGYTEFTVGSGRWSFRSTLPVTATTPEPPAPA